MASTKFERRLGKTRSRVVTRSLQFNHASFEMDAMEEELCDERERER